MILGSHNSWSYLTPKRWWMKLISFTAKCQSINIKTQYEKYGVRCFDLRVNFRNGLPQLSHGIIEYNYTDNQLDDDLEYLNNKKDVYVRVIHEERNSSGEVFKQDFIHFCYTLVEKWPNIKFWGGRNLYNWNIDYHFSNDPSCEEKYGSVCNPKFIDDWYPLIYAKKHNKEILQLGTDKDILLIDFVNYGH